uniref:Uncharacterized protein n=1 Tax=Pithovirus LCPAC101 TaxID=2506586 RepID=A0A481Z2E4_9VIRU|nr:MAG: hypothetical protein LCPAC101_01360 [Pithovirus LCPAC101]
MVGFPVSYETLKHYVLKNSDYIDAIDARDAGDAMDNMDEDEIKACGNDIMAEYLQNMGLISTKNFYEVGVYRMPCCYIDISPHKYIFGMIIRMQSPWTDYELFDLMSLPVANEETVWDKFMNMSDSNIEWAIKLYNSNPNIPPMKGTYGKYNKIGAFALEYIKKVLIKKKMTASEFMKYKQVVPCQLYDMYFARISFATVKYLTEVYNELPVKDEKYTITNIAMSDDCYTCT